VTILGRRRKGALRKAYRTVETRILAAEGRKAVRARAVRAARLVRKAIRTGLVTGGIAAAAVVVRAVRKGRRDR
jgi:hypothetical protein